MKHSDRKRRRRRLGLLGALVLAASTVLGLSCSSLSKAELQERLVALPKNAPFGPLRLLPLRADLGDGEQELELVYAHAPAREPVADALPVVLVHGTPATLYGWAEIMHGGADFAGLDATRDVYALEVIGHGVAPGDVGPYTFQRCARFVVAALEALELPRVHLVGNSYGGEFVWRAALDAPERLASLTLIDSSGYPRREGDWLPEEEQMRDNPLAKIGWLLNSEDRITTALAPHFDEIPPGRVEEFFLVCDNADNWHAMIDLARDENGERAGELPRLATPTLVMWGADDIAYPLDVYGRRFAADLPDARLEVLEDTGHYPHEQRPAEVVESLRRFFSEVEAR